MDLTMINDIENFIKHAEMLIKNKEANQMEHRQELLKSHINNYMTAADCAGISIDTAIIDMVRVMLFKLCQSSIDLNGKEVVFSALEDLLSSILEEMKGFDFD